MMILYKETIREEQADAKIFFPSIEIMLNGNIFFDELMNTIARFKVPCKLIKADIEYWGRVNYGVLVLQLLVNIREAEDIMKYFRQKNIKYIIKHHD